MKGPYFLRRRQPKMVFLLLILMSGCAVVPVTDRKQMTLVSNQQMIVMGLTAYDNFISHSRISNDRSNTVLVEEVGRDIARAVETYCSENNFSDRISGFKWEFTLVDNKTANAFCLPGGKVVIYTGLLPYTKDRNGLAVVVGHEIAHVIAQHGNERMSQQLLKQFGGIALSLAISKKPQETQNLYNVIYEVGSTLGVILPYSRIHELEADKLGLIFMSLAGYDPKAAISFWERMSTVSGSSLPVFFRTHPTDNKRIAEIKNAMPEILRYRYLSK